MIITSLSVEDIDAVFAIEQAAHPFPWPRSDIERALQYPYQAAVFRQDNRILGYWICQWLPPEATLMNIAVAPAAQGQGVGRALLADLCEEARVAKLENIFLEVREHNQRARALYEKQGFMVIDERRDYYPVQQGGRENAIIMSLPILPV